MSEPTITVPWTDDSMEMLDWSKVKVNGELATDLLIQRDRYREANEALIEVERRVREFSPRFVAWMKEVHAPEEIKEAYRWAIYGSAVHAQAFIVKPSGNQF